MIFTGLTFDYDLRIEAQTAGDREPSCTRPHVEMVWLGRAVSNRPVFNTPGMVGARPTFEIRGRQLTLHSPDGEGQKFPAYFFADGRSKGSPNAPEREHSFSEPEREVCSVSVTVDETLTSVLRVGDELHVALYEGGGFCYHLTRNLALVLAAGTVTGRELEAGFVVTQEYEPDLEDPPPEPKFMNLGGVRFPIARITPRKPFITAQIGEQRFELVDGQAAFWNSCYVFLARSNNSFQMTFGAIPNPIFAAARLNQGVTKEIVECVARQMLRPAVRLQ